MNLIKGKAYIVRHENSKRAVRRIYKGTEERFGQILCYVFTGRVSKKVIVRLEENPNGVSFWHWSGVSHAPCEISIPFYNLKQAVETY